MQNNEAAQHPELIRKAYEGLIKGTSIRYWPSWILMYIGRKLLKEVMW